MFRRNNKRWFNKLSKWGQFLIVLIETKKQLNNMLERVNETNLIDNGELTDFRPPQAWTALHTEHDIIKAYNILIDKDWYLDPLIKANIYTYKNEFTKEDLKFLKRASFKDIIELLEEIE